MHPTLEKLSAMKCSIKKFLLLSQQISVSSSDSLKVILVSFCL